MALAQTLDPESRRALVHSALGGGRGREGGREGGRERGKEGGREGGREGVFTYAYRTTSISPYRLVHL